MTDNDDYLLLLDCGFCHIEKGDFKTSDFVIKYDSHVTANHGDISFFQQLTL